MLHTHCVKIISDFWTLLSLKGCHNVDTVDKCNNFLNKIQCYSLNKFDHFALWVIVSEILAFKVGVDNFDKILLVATECKQLMSTVTWSWDIKLIDLKWLRSSIYNCVIFQENQVQGNHIGSLVDKRKLVAIVMGLSSPGALH